MEEQQQREWYDLRSKTWRLLRQRGHLLRSKHRPLLQYLVMPSFTDTLCIDFVLSEDTIAAYRTVWKVTQDVEAFRTVVERLKHPRPLVPTLESTRLNISQAIVESLMSRLRHATIPLKPVRSSISQDGTLYELSIGDGWTGLLLQWQNQLPDEWHHDLHEAVSVLRAMVAT